MRKKGWFNPSHKNSAGFSDDVMNASVLYCTARSIGAVGPEITRMRKFRLLA